MKQLLCAATVVVTAATSSTPATACSYATDDTAGDVTFANRTVPRNAELWITLVDDIIAPGSELYLSGPGRRELVPVLERDGSGARLVTSTPLAPGDWLFRAREVYDGETYDSDYRFEVSDDDDTVAPPAPKVKVTHADYGGWPGPISDTFMPCSPRERETVRMIEIEVSDDDDIARVVIDGESFNARGGYVSVANRQEDGSDVVVSAFDFAGNESEVVVASSVREGGCASMPASTSLFGAVLVLVRRRRRRS